MWSPGPETWGWLYGMGVMFLAILLYAIFTKTIGAVIHAWQGWRSHRRDVAWAKRFGIGTHYREKVTRGR
jgi:hypothetical protein